MSGAIQELLVPLISGHEVEGGTTGCMWLQEG